MPGFGTDQHHRFVAGLEAKRRMAAAIRDQANTADSGRGQDGDAVRLVVKRDVA